MTMPICPNCDGMNIEPRGGFNRCRACNHVAPVCDFHREPATPTEKIAYILKSRPVGKPAAYYRQPARPSSLSDQEIRDFWWMRD